MVADSFQGAFVETIKKTDLYEELIRKINADEVDQNMYKIHNGHYFVCIRDKMVDDLCSMHKIPNTHFSAVNTNFNEGSRSLENHNYGLYWPIVSVQ